MYHTEQSDRATALQPPRPIQFDEAQRLAQALSQPWTESPGPSGQASDLPQISDYVIDRPLGQGGGGTVFHAVLPGWNDEFAIKLLHKPVADTRVARRVWRELDVAERLKLPDTPRVFEYGVHEGRIFIVSEMIRGEPLDAYCRDQDMSLRERVALLVRLCDAVHALHERGVIHRDIKPSNVLVRADGSPVVIDLGISTLVENELADTLTATGAAIGTIAFMAPEQARGEIARTSIQTDIYSLGATACAILTGATPHDVHGVAVLEAIQRVGHEPPRRPEELDPTLPGALAAGLAKAVALDPEDRYRSVAEFGDELQCWLDGRPGNVQPRRWWRTLACAIRRRPGRWAWAAAVGVAILGSGAFAGVAQWQHLDERLELLADLEAKQAELDWHHGVIEKNVQLLLTRSRSQEFKDAQRALGIVEGYAHYGLVEGELAQRLELNRSAFLSELLHGVHAGLPNRPTRSELAFETVRALYQDDGIWDADRADRLGRAIRDLE